ncbi:hypothetical protein L209DRAFT_21976 [Thermothelomyces heterothallicus CBS 203.75]
MPHSFEMNYRSSCVVASHHFGATTSRFFFFFFFEKFVFCSRGDCDWASRLFALPFYTNRQSDRWARPCCRYASKRVNGVPYRVLLPGHLFFSQNLKTTKDQLLFLDSQASEITPLEGCHNCMCMYSAPTATSCSSCWPSVERVGAKKQTLMRDRISTKQHDPMAALKNLQPEGHGMELYIHTHFG